MENLTPRPLPDRVLVRQDPPKDKIGSFYVPQGKEVWDAVGTVVAVGSRITIKDEIPPGTRVQFKRQAGSALITDRRESDYEEWKDLLMLKEENILLVIEDEGAS